jgi:DNA-binding LacI/PurR family transcriptional regulator
MTKAESIARVLEGRIERGDYILADLHSDRKVAEDFGVSRVTARNALQRLEKNGLITRKGNGRLELAASQRSGAGAPNIAFLAASFPSPFVQNLRVMSEAAALADGCRFRPIDYLHWTDTVVAETFQRFDGVILCHVGDAIPPLLRSRIVAKGTAVLSIGRDLTADGIPSLLVNPPAGVQHLLDHLAGLGHRSIDCLWASTPGPSGPPRVEQWNVWRHAHGIPGELLEVPIAPFVNPMTAAHTALGAALDAGRMRGSALFCTDELAAIGACRALHEHGREPGRDIAVCTFGGDELCRFLVPSLTALEYPDLVPYLRIFTSCLAGGSRTWSGPLLMSPPDRLVARESTARFPQ